MKTMTAKTAATTLAASGVLLAMTLLAGCGNKGPLVRPSDVPPPAVPTDLPAPATPPADGAG